MIMSLCNPMVLAIAIGDYDRMDEDQGIGTPDISKAAWSHVEDVIFQDLPVDKDTDNLKELFSD